MSLELFPIEIFNFCRAIFERPNFLLCAPKLPDFSLKFFSSLCPDICLDFWTHCEATYKRQIPIEKSDFCRAVSVGPFVFAVLTHGCTSLAPLIHSQASEDTPDQIHITCRAQVVLFTSLVVVILSGLDKVADNILLSKEQCSVLSTTPPTYSQNRHEKTTAA